MKTSAEMTLLEYLMRIDQGINNEYRVSKAPKFIKNMKLKKHRKELIKSINDFTGYNIIDAAEVSYFVRQIFDIYGGTYEHCQKVDMDADENLIAVFTKELESKASVTAIITCKGIVLDIRYTLFNPSRQKETNFGEFDVEDLRNKKHHDRIVYPWSVTDQALCIRDIIAETIIDDIKHFLNDMIVRSERINSNE